MQRVMIHKASYADCRQAVNRAFELFPQKIAGKKVVIKPNVLRISEAAEGIVTHPAVLRAVVDKVETMGPAAIIAMGAAADTPNFSSSSLMSVERSSTVMLAR